MTSSRGQKVSILPCTDTTSIRVFPGTKGSLRSAPRNTSLRTDKKKLQNEKSFAQHPSKNFSTSAFETFKNRDCSSINKFSSALITNSVISSSELNSINRELSPVRWCDREVDGVYLGRSGWVQVQQRSLDDCKEGLHNENIGLSTLPSRKKFSDFSLNCRFKGRRECNRPLNLLLPTKKLTCNYERPSKFTQEFESESPPSVTPIISPPPAFKDDNLDVKFSRLPARKSHFCNESFSQRPETFADPDILPSLALETQDTLNSSSSAMGSVSSPFSILNHRRPLQQTLHTKSFEDGHSHKMWRSRRLDSTSPYTLLGFRSFDEETKINDEIKVSLSDSFDRNFVNLEEKIYKEENKDENVCKKHFLGLQSSSWETLNEQRFLSKPFPRLNCQNNKRRNFDEDRWNAYRTRSSSLDSSGSSTSNSSTSSKISINCKNSEKKILRKTDSKQSQKSKLENSFSRDRRHFNVKRSKSLQLSERKSPNESVLLNNSLSEKSWNPMLIEGSTFQPENHNKEFFSQRFLNHVLVTVNGESIPVDVSDSQFIRSLNKITKSGVEQKKLIMEAEKEAKLITEFMSRTKSRAAARNLLMHRYFNQFGDGNSTVLMKRKNLSKTEQDCHSLAISPLNKQNCLTTTHFDVGSFRRKNQFFPLNPDFRRYSAANYHKPLISAFPSCSQGFYQSGSFTSSHSYLDQKKGEKVKTKKKEKSRKMYPDQPGDNNLIHKTQTTRIRLDQAHLSSRFQKERPEFFLNQKQKLNNFESLDNGKLENDSADIDLKKLSKNATQNLPVGVTSKIEKRNFRSNAFEENSLISSQSSSSSSSSNDICTPDLKLIEAKRMMGSSTFYYQDTNSKTLQDAFYFRPGSAPESDGCISKNPDKRSLSLPRSFLSERYKLNDLYQRNELPLKQECLRTRNELPKEHHFNFHSSQTAPTTPVRDLRYDKSTESLNQSPSTRSSCAFLSGETPLFKSRRIIQETAPKKSKDSNERNVFFVCKSRLKISDGSSETVLQKFKKNFSLKYLKTKEYLKSNTERISQKAADESFEILSTANFPDLSFDLQAIENDNCDIYEQAHGFVKEKDSEKKAFNNEKYDSQDSGIQLINRAIVDSSESQDTDVQEDVDSPFAIRRREIHAEDNFCELKSEVFNQILINKFKADLQKRLEIRKQCGEKVIKRSYSDFGDQRLLKGNGKNYNETFDFYFSPIGRPNAKTWKPTNSEVSIKLNTFERFLKSRLKRSLSQPLGLNEPARFEKKRPQTLKKSVLSEGDKNACKRNSEDELLSESESSVASLIDRKKCFDFVTGEQTTVLAEAVWDHVAIEPCELPFRAGDLITVLDTKDRDWWWGATKESSGCFPPAFVRLCVSQEDTVEDCLVAMTENKNTSKQLRRSKNISFLSNDQVRSKIIKEMLNTERDFVKILHDVKDGYITQCKRRTDMFTTAHITTIFSNLEHLLIFQDKFLEDLEANIDREFPFKSCIGKVFLNHGSGFQMYSEYCNSHPMAIATLQDLYQKYNYCKFFEMCRLKQSLIEIPLDGYLLTPVQRICKYPLQLSELLKYTKPDHPDYNNVREALETMRSVAVLINERKRKMESLEKLAAWQQRVENWEGEDLIEISSQLIHQGDVVKVTSGMWTTNITLFLFDHQIIYCKKDLLKKNVYIYKGRITLDDSDIIDIPDGKSHQLGMNIKHGLGISSSLKDKCLVFYCRSSEDKAKWLEALAEEKRLVAKDKEKGLDLPPTAKELAKMSVRTNKCSPCKLKGKYKFAVNRDALFCRENHSDVSKSRSSRRVGTWFFFGRVMKSTKSRASVHRFT